MRVGGKNHARAFLGQGRMCRAPLDAARLAKGRSNLLQNLVWTRSRCDCKEKKRTRRPRWPGKTYSLRLWKIAARARGPQPSLRPQGFDEATSAYEFFFFMP